MATTTKKNTKTTAPPPPVNDPLQINVDRKRQIRLGFGIFFLLTGIFTFFSIISYCFSWSADQDKFLSSSSLFDFLFRDQAPVANWGGRLGATLSHILVYNGAGIASLTIGIAI